MLFHPRKRLDPHLIEALENLRSEWLALKLRRRSRRISAQGRRYLHLGCGENSIDGFLNTDFPMNPRAEAWIDMRFPLPFGDQAWKGVYAHHSVEHVSYQDAHRLFAEIHRVLEPKGTFRMVVPNLEVFLRHYCSGDESIFSLLPPWHMELLSVETPLEMIDWMFRDGQHNRHLSSWDFSTAEARLRQAGFREVIRQNVNECVDPSLGGHDNPGWMTHSLYVDAIK